jgi:hypothetical protein
MWFLGGFRANANEKDESQGKKLGHQMLEHNNPSRAYFVKGQIVAINQAVLAGEISCIAASRRLHCLGIRLLGDIDEDFTVFIALDSETDHLAIGIEERASRSQGAAALMDLEIAAIEAREKSNIEQACRVLVRRFQFVD